VTNDYEVDQRPDGSFIVTGPNDMELWIIPAKVPKNRDKEIIKWLLLHSPESDRDVQGCYMVTWLPEANPSGRFISRGKSHEECVLNFIDKKAKRIE
jgi:hypothetical protein